MERLHFTTRFLSVARLLQKRYKCPMLQLPVFHFNLYRPIDDVPPHGRDMYRSLRALSYRSASLSRREASLARTGEAPVLPFERQASGPPGILRERSQDLKDGYARLRQESFELREEASRLGQEPLLRAFSGGLEGTATSPYGWDLHAYAAPLPLLPESYDDTFGKEVRSACTDMYMYLCMYRQDIYMYLFLETYEYTCLFSCKYG